MIKILEEYEDFLSWSEGKLEIHKFCEKWVPNLYEIKPTHEDYTSACVHLVSRVTGRNTPTVYNWLANRRSVPLDMKKLLFLLI